MAQAAADSSFVDGQEPNEERVKSSDDPRKNTTPFLCRAFGMPVILRLSMSVLGIEPDELRAKERNNRHGYQVGCRQCKNNGQGQGSKEIFTNSIEEHIREEDDGCTDGCGKYCQLNFFTSVLRSRNGFFAFLHVAKDIFQNNYGVIDQP